MSINRRNLLTVTCFVVCAVLASTLAFSAPIPPQSARTAAGTFLSTQSSVAAKPAATEPSDLRDADGNLLGYVVSTSSGGYVVTAADTDIPPILAYSATGSFPTEPNSDNPAWHLIAGLVADWQENLELNIPEASAAKVAHNGEWDRYLSGTMPARKPSEEQTVWGPLVETQWGQLAPYNKFCPIDPNTGERSKVGCVPVQSAQILNYWKYPTSITLTEEDAFVSKQYGGQGLDYQTVLSTIDIPGDSETLDFATFEELNALLAEITYSGDEDETAAFCFANAILARTNLSSWASSAGPAQYKTIGFESTHSISDWLSAKEALINNVKKGWPMGMTISGYYTSGPNDGKTVGHAVVLDGFDAESAMFHVNMGHAGDGDGWFLFPDMDANWAYFNAIHQVLINIVRESGTLSGKITDAGTGGGIPGVQITILPVNIPILTDMDGSYSINLPPGSYSLKFKHAQYTNSSRSEVLITDGESLTADASLTYDSPVIAHFSFEGDGTDEAGNVNPLAVKETVEWVDGPSGTAAWIHGSTTEYTSHAFEGYNENLGNPDGADWTIETWVALPETDAYYQLITHQSYKLLYSHGALIFWLHNNDDNRVMGPFKGNGISLKVPFPVQSNEWFHVAGVYTQNEKMVLYVNGIQVASQPSGNILGSIPGADSSVGKIDIGQPFFASHMGIDEVRITAAALQPSDFVGYPFAHEGYGTITGVITESNGTLPVPGAGVNFLPDGAGSITDENGRYFMTVLGDREYQLTVTCAGYQGRTVESVSVTASAETTVDVDINPSESPTVVWYRFDGNGNDSSGNDSNLSIFTSEQNGYGPIEWTEGIEGQSLVIPAHHDSQGLNFISVETPGHLVGYPGHGDWTVETWVKIPFMPPMFEILYHPSLILGYQGYSGNPALPSNNVILDMNGCLVTAPYSTNSEKWVHIAGVYHYRDRVELYINGELAAQEPAPDVPNVYAGAPLIISEQSVRDLTIDDLRITAAALDPSEFLYATTAVEHDAEPLVFSIGANYPNPFNPTTTIPFTLAEEEFTTLVIYNLMGQKVRELATGRMQPGAHTVVWDGRNDAGKAVASGVYLSRLVAGESEQVRRMVLVK